MYRYTYEKFSSSRNYKLNCLSLSIFFSRFQIPLFIWPRSNGNQECAADVAISYNANAFLTQSSVQVCDEETKSGENPLGVYTWCSLLSCTVIAIWALHIYSGGVVDDDSNYARGRYYRPCLIKKICLGKKLD